MSGGPVGDDLFRLLVSSVRDYAIFHLDVNGRVASWNAGAERIKGYQASEIIGQSFEVFYPPEDLHKCARALEAAQRDGSATDEGYRVRKDGSRFWANVVITALFDGGKHIGFAKVTRDLTERRAAEEERVRLAQSNEALRLRDEFLSIASHELKTPLTALKLQVQSLLHERAALEPRVATKLERIDRATLRITQLVDTLLDVSRIATGRLKLRAAPEELRAVVTEVVERHDARARAANVAVSLHADEDVVVHGDRLRLDQIVANLLDNAIKYGGRTPVDITVRAEGDVAMLLVEDRGPGVPVEQRGRIFERFERAVSENHGGLGLGLYVTREIVAAHAGKIAVEDRPGGGASFVVRLPRWVTPK